MRVIAHLISVLVNCRIGSLEKGYEMYELSGNVNCRIGSLEMLGCRVCVIDNR